MNYLGCLWALGETCDVVVRSGPRRSLRVFMCLHVYVFNLLCHKFMLLYVISDVKIFYDVRNAERRGWNDLVMQMGRLSSNHVNFEG